MFLCSDSRVKTASPSCSALETGASAAMIPAASSYSARREPEEKIVVTLLCYTDDVDNPTK